MQPVIAHFNTLQRGGAATSAWRLHEGLLRLGTDSRFVCAQTGPSSDSTLRVLSPRAGNSLISRVVHLCRRAIDVQLKRDTALPHTVISNPRSGYRPSDFEFSFHVDIYHLHWIAGLIDWPTVIPWMSRRAPLVWTLHDLNPLMGIWHYEPQECERTAAYERKNAAALEVKAAALSSIPGDRLVIVSPSRWLQKKVGESSLLGRFTVHQIPYGLDTDVFHPIPREVARAALGLRGDFRVVAFAADSLSDPRKGGEFLLSALQKIDPQKLVCLTAGGNQQAPEGVRCINLGVVESERLMALFYSAADIVVCPSFQDNLPNTVLEAMACGTAVIGTRVGGIPEMIRPGENGWLVSPGNSDELAATITNALNDGETLERNGRSSREIALKEYSLVTQAQAYRKLYEDLLQSESVSR